MRIVSDTSLTHFTSPASTLHYRVLVNKTEFCLIVLITAGALFWEIAQSASFHTISVAFKKISVILLELGIEYGAFKTTWNESKTEVLRSGTF